ncbi:MAG: hypothetical protein WA957_06460 [Alteraurantiacibacter sp.]
MEVLSGAKLAEKIRQVCHGPGPHEMAVAFWGPHVAAALFPSGLDGVKVILDVSMGGTSKDALHALGVPETSSVFVCDGLHTKLYIGAVGAVVASANASTNALGANLDGGWLQEVGVWIDAVVDAPAYRQAKAEFERILKASSQATQLDVDRAPSRASLRTITWREPETENASLLELVAEDPERFSDTLFIFGDMKLTAEQVEAAEKALQRFHDEEVEDQTTFGDILMLEPGEHSKIDHAEPHSFVIMYFWSDNDRLPRLQAFNSICASGKGHEGDVHFFGRDDWEYFCKKHELAGNLLEMESLTRADLGLAKKLRGKEAKGYHWQELTAGKVAGIIGCQAE